MLQNQMLQNPIPYIHPPLHIIYDTDDEEEIRYRPVANLMVPQSFRLIEHLITHEFSQIDDNQLRNYLELWKVGFFCPPFKSFFFRVPQNIEDEWYCENLINYFYFALLVKIEFVRTIENGFNRDTPTINADLPYYPRRALEITNRIANH